MDLTHPLVMGVLNVTPDSFSDGGRFEEPRAAIQHGVRMAEEGAAILDVGGESTRPGADPVPEDQELRRVLPVIEGLRAATGLVISIDTRKPRVMRLAAQAGAELINDVTALSAEGALEAVIESQCSVCLMHMQGDPKSMQIAPHYTDVVEEVRAFLHGRARECEAAGVPRDRIAIDPGFGFGKTSEHNLQLLRGLRALGSQWPVVVGLSRKSLVGRLTGRASGERLHGSLALAIIAVLNGASVVRAHDVAATVDAIRTVIAVQGG